MLDVVNASKTVMVNIAVERIFVVSIRAQNALDRPVDDVRL